MMELFKRRTKNTKGFTLIELIVVIAILGILAAVAIPRFGGLQESANKKAILSNLTMLENAVKTYAVENNVADSAVTKALLNTATGLVPTWPVGPKVTTTYDIVAGVPTATLSAAIPGVPAASYTTASAALQ